MEQSNEIKYFNFNKKPGEKAKKACLIDNVEHKVEIITLYSNKIDMQKTFNSIINQTFIYWQWNIIVPNGQTCNLESYKDSRIKFYSEIDKEDLEYKIAKESNCKYIIFLKAGDVLDTSTIECAYWSLETNPEASWVYSNYVINGKILEKTDFTFEREKQKNIVSPSYMIRRREYLDIKNNVKEINSDWELFLNLLDQNKFPVKMSFYGSWNNSIEENISDKIRDKQILLKQNRGGINYPVGSDYWFDTAPFELEWNLKNIKKNNKKTNLLFIFPWLRLGGADKFNYDLISNLDKEKYNITIITTEPCEYIWRQKFEEYAEIFDLTSFLHRKYWSAFIHYIIKTRNINLVMNSNSYYGYYVIPWLKYKFPEVIFTDYLHAVNWNWRNGEYPTDSTAIARILDETFVTSNNLKETMIKQMGRKVDNTKVIYIGVDDKIFDENNSDIKMNDQLIANKYKYENKKVILFCCRISKEKRPILMLKIFEKIRKDRDDVVLFVVGDGDQLQLMENTAEELNLKDDVIFFGTQEDVRIFYKLSDVLVVCSIREGITLTTYEALSMSTPVVSADVGGQAEIIDDSTGRIVKNTQNVIDGENSVEYSVDEIDNYAKAIVEIIDNKEYAKIKKSCRDKIEDKYTINKMVANMDCEYHNLIKNGTKISKDIINNEEMYKQYLVLYNEADRRFYNSAKGGIILEPEENIEDSAIKQKDLEIKKLKAELDNIYNSKRWKYINKVLKFLRK